jgi:hypothetical protein
MTATRTLARVIATPSNRPDLCVQLPHPVKLVTARIVSAIITPLVPRGKSDQVSAMGKRAAGVIAKVERLNRARSGYRPVICVVRSPSACRAASRLASSDA